jgi:acetyl/propionyl-CoA carboxylase alpha subunit
MLAKLIVSGDSRASAIETAKLALAQFQVAGLKTTVPFHAELVNRPEFGRAEIHTRWIEENLQMTAH